MVRDSVREHSDTGPTLYWYDLETFGLDPVRDRIAQFAGVRTGLDLNIVGPPQILYCKPPLDYLPDPASCLVTGITPRLAHHKGRVEAEFIAAIRSEFLRPETCVVGYNNLRFDDEVVRHTLYRNLFDPYEREWRNGNSRWDIIDMVRLVAALRPEGLDWPMTEDGRPSFRLEALTAANGIPHSGAHDALADVLATIGLARLIKTSQPRLYDFVFCHRGKQRAAELLNLGSFAPVVHVSGRYSSERHNLAIVVPLSRHPANNNGVVVYDLSVDPTPLIELDVDAVRRRVFTSATGKEPNPLRIPLKTVHLNKCPVLAPVKAIRPVDEVRLALDHEAIAAHLARLRAAPGIAQKVAAVFEPAELPAETDPDVLLYRGGFLDDADRAQLNRMHQRSARDVAVATTSFHDPRLPEMVFRYRARNYPELLTPDERERWEAFRLAGLEGSDRHGMRTLGAYQAAIADLEASVTEDAGQRAILAELRDYGRMLVRKNPSVLPYT